MNKSIISVSLWISFAVISSGAHAYLENLATCTNDSITLTHIEESPLNGSNTVFDGNINATSCVGVFLEGAPDTNDDANGRSSPMPNIGHLEDGFLNGQPLENGDPDSALDPYSFIDSPGVDDSPSLSQPYDIPGNASIFDPGWIHLARVGDGSPSYSTVGAGANTLDLADILEITWLCSATGCGSGTWSIETDPNIVAIVQDLLGPNTFDHLAISIFQANKLAVYDFDFTILTQPGNDLFGTIDFVTAYSFSGEWNMGDFAPQSSSFSHVNFWARDPADTPQEVPAPGSLLLLITGLIGLSLARRCQNLPQGHQN